MTVGFGPKRPVIPPSNLGVNDVAARRVAEAAGRAAERTRIAVSVDALPTRLWLRNPRGSVACPCSAGQLGPRSTPLSPTDTGTITLTDGQGNDERAVDADYPLDGPLPQAAEELPAPAPEGFKSDWVDSIGRLLLGDGRRCGLCWGTGWIDGHRLWGGQRYLCCAVGTPWTTVDPSSDADVDLESPTPTLVGPATVTWQLSIQPGMRILDAIRVRDGLRPALSGWSISVCTPQFPNGADVSVALGVVFGAVQGQPLDDYQVPTSITLTLARGVRVSHIELVLRSEPLVNLQLPNLQMTASTELVQPFINDDFELDPIVGWVERGSVLEVPGLGGRIGSVWLVTDVNENRTAQGVTWNVTGSARNVQPNDILACVSMEDALTIGILDPGLASRGLESTGAGVPSGNPDGSTDDSVHGVWRGEQQRAGGGASPSKPTVIVLTPSPED